MNETQIRELLQKVQQNDTSVDSAFEILKDLPYTDLGFANIDNHREIRQGYPEVIYCAGKTVAQVAEIFRHMFRRGQSNILATRADMAMYEALADLSPDLEYNAMARTISLRRQPQQATEGYIVIVTAGTSDMPIAEEARVTAEVFGNNVVLINDVGVAGLHRLTPRLKTIRQANVAIVIAGMEGALASVVGGLTDKPIIAVPTSIGYGANFGGLSALLGMLNSCSSGVSVVNIDNGFGAAYSASLINKLCQPARPRV